MDTQKTYRVVTFLDLDDPQYWGLESNGFYAVLDTKRNAWDDDDILLIALVTCEGLAGEHAWVGADVLDHTKLTVTLPFNSESANV